LTRTNDGGGIVLSSDFICRGGTGGGFVEFIDDSVSINIEIKFKTTPLLPSVSKMKMLS
jgi:hypothetical protein